ncbi:MAG: bifunctional [glutamine synthetase] adenylyltransferase/[glutamine synthetase]-adenylyl-L-tyrosine phosphorylase, partial [Nocardioides sp.]
MSRAGSRTGRGALIRAGFAEPTRARELLSRLGPYADPLLAVLARTADPDHALAGLLSLAERVGETRAGEAGADTVGADTAADGDSFLRAVAHDEGTAMRLLLVLGVSEALTEHLLRHPEHWRELTDPLLGTTRPPRYWLRATMLASVGADPGAAAPVATVSDDACLTALRVEYRRHLLRLVSRDLADQVGIDDVAAELSDLAVGTLEAALAVARARVGESASAARLAVIALGKCGGHELNYVSDVDVVFVYEPADGVDHTVASRVAAALATHVIGICSEHTAEGTIWPVDAALRPEGSAGPLVRTVTSHLSYYQRWATTWEFQALLKARAAAGDRELADRYAAAIGPLVWSAATRDHFVEDVQAMRRRVVEHIPADHAERQLKL